MCWKAGSGAFRVQAPGQRERYVRMGHAGVADIIGVLPMARQSLLDGTRSTFGRFLAIEVKRPGQQPTQAQAAFLASVQMAGGLAFVATSVDDVRGSSGGRDERRGRAPRAAGRGGGGAEDVAHQTPSSTRTIGALVQSPHHRDARCSAAAVGRERERCAQMATMEALDARALAMVYRDDDAVAMLAHILRRTGRADGCGHPPGAPPVSA